MSASDTIEAQGHLIDSGLLSAIFDKIIELKGSYEILDFDIGRTNDDPSRIQQRAGMPCTNGDFAGSAGAGNGEGFLRAIREDILRLVRSHPS